MVERSDANATAEYVALRDEAAVVENLHQLVWIRGTDAVSFLEGILSQDVAGAQPGDVTRTLLLQPNGKLEAVGWILVGTEEVGLIVDAGFGEHVASVLNRYRIRVKVEIDVEARPVREIWGRHAEEALTADGISAPIGWDSDGSVVVARIPLGELPRFFVIGADLSAPPAGESAARALRVEAGEPVMGSDLSGKTIPQETGLVPASVSFTKGCYLGQELVARIDTRGHVNRRLMGVIVDEQVLPPEGSSLWVGEKEVGNLTSPAESLTLGVPIGLALVRREVEAGAPVRIDWQGGAATGRVVDLPLSTFDEL